MIRINVSRKNDSCKKEGRLSDISSHIIDLYIIILNKWKINFKNHTCDQDKNDLIYVTIYI